MGVNEAKYGALEKLFNAKFTILSEDLKKVQQNTIEAEIGTLNCNSTNFQENS